MSEAVSSLYLVLLACTAVVCVAQIAVSLYRPSERLGLPLVVALAFLYFYVVQSYISVQSLGHVLPVWMFEMGQLAALLSLCLFLAGWHLSRRRARPVPPRPVSGTGRSDPIVYLGGLLGLAAGAVGAQLTAELYVDSREIPAYAYMTFHLGYPGALLCAQVVARNRWYRNPLMVLPPLVLLAVALAPAVAYTRRGPMFPMMTVLLYGYYLARGRAVNPVVVTGGVVAAGVIMLVFLSVRLQSRAGEFWSADRLENLSGEQVLLSRAARQDDNEFLYHCALTGTVWETGATNYGTGYVALLLHWVPRSLWEDKPALGQGFLGENAVELIPGVTGIRVSGGAATGGVGDTITHLGASGLLVWLGIGWLAGKLYTRGQDDRSLTRQSTYVALVASSHWLVSQGVTAAFVPFVIYALYPPLVYAMAGAEERTSR